MTSPPKSPGGSQPPRCDGEHYLGRNDPGFQRYQWDNEFCSCTNPTCKPLSFLAFFRFCPGSASHLEVGREPEVVSALLAVGLLAFKVVHSRRHRGGGRLPGRDCI